MSHPVHKANVRKRFQPRREPYWAAPLAPGRYIGFRKIDAERGSWIARARSENGPQQYNALGALTGTFGYDAACKAAQEWFANLDAGVVTNSRCTVEDACKAYVEDRRREKGEKTAADAEWRFKYTVYGTEFGSTVLARLRTPAIKRWREGIKLTKSGANRMMASLRAALNLAVDNRQVPATAAQEWRGVKQYKGADGRRELYLDLAQRRALLAAATGGVRDLIEAALVTGARPGELVAAPRGAFDARTKTLTLRGKTGARTVPLSPAAVALFERLSKSKLPTAPLLTRDDGKSWQRAEAAVVKGVNRNDAKLPVAVCAFTRAGTATSLKRSWTD